MTDRERLLALLRERSLRTGEFLLSSGRKSAYYVDARLTTMSGVGQLLIGRLGLQTLDRADWPADAVGGLTLGADPIALAIAHAAAAAGRELQAFTVRKQPKAHGSARLVEGPIMPGMNVVVVEDTLTTGASAGRAATAVEEYGASVLGVLALVDRQEGGRERLEAAGRLVQAVFGVSELLGAG